ncbi:MAG: hypothetical protein IKA32_07695 [Lentisphaeria bacterium]|nr:hypothetical protein [Lentisphaeria bacterium]
MIDDTKRLELEDAVDVLVKHNLYRRGHCEMHTAGASEKEIGIAIDTAAGAILEYLNLDTHFLAAAKKIGKLRYELAQQESITKSTLHMLDECRAENRRLKALLASHRIKYKA